MKNILIAIPLSLALVSAAPVWGGEHPREHPKESSGKEHPGEKHEAGSKAWEKQMHKEFVKAVKAHVKERKAAEGSFRIEDEKLGKVWKLKLLRVHKKRVVGLGGKSFFACADFKSVEKGSKDKLDLDFYATKGPDGWKIDKVLIHKVNGKPRYTYNDKNERVPVKD